MPPGEAELQHIMAKKWEIQKTFDKGRRPRRHLSAKGRKALRDLRVSLILVAICFALLFAWALQNRPRETPVHAHDVGPGALR